MIGGCAWPAKLPGGSMKTGSLRELIRAREFLHMPAVYDPLGGLLVQNSGFKVRFVGGYVTGAALAISEPLLTMTEQVGLAGAVANAIAVPLIADAGAGWGDALHTMRTGAEFCKAGVSRGPSHYPPFPTPAPH